MNIMELEERQAYVSLATNDSYCIGVLVWAQSLRNVNTKKEIVVMITTGVSSEMRKILSIVCDKVVEVNVLDSRDSVNLNLLERKELGITFTKLHCWRLTDYDKCVFMDADTLVIQNIDELFSFDELSAAPDPGWPDCFNSGVFVFKPSLKQYEELLKFALNTGSFDGGDQGLLNLYFKNWNRISFIYNCVAQSFYSYLPAYKQFGKNVKVAHFIGHMKPWDYNIESSAIENIHEHSIDFLNKWWKIFHHHIRSILPNEFLKANASLEKNFLELANMDDSQRRYQWEHGQIDYKGIDKFENIQRKLDSMMDQPKIQNPNGNIKSNSNRSTNKSTSTKIDTSTTKSILKDVSKKSDDTNQYQLNKSDSKKNEKDQAAHYPVNINLSNISTSGHDLENSKSKSTKSLSSSSKMSDTSSLSTSNKNKDSKPKSTVTKETCMQSSASNISEKLETKAETNIKGKVVVSNLDIHGTKLKKNVTKGKVNTSQM